MGCLYVTVFRVGNGMDVTTSRVGNWIEVTAFRAGNGMNVTASKVGDEMDVTVRFVCVITLPDCYYWSDGIMLLFDNNEYMLIDK